MNKLILAFCLLAISNIMCAQDLEIQWKKTSEPIATIDGKGNFVYPSKVLEDKYREYQQPRSLYYIKTNSKSYAKLSGINKKTKKLEVAYQEVTAKELKGESKLIVNHDYFAPKVIGPFTSGNLDAAGTYLSPDKKTLVYIDNSGLVDNKEVEKWNITVFDEDLNTLWTRTFSPGLNDVSVELVNIAVTNTGKVILIAKILKKDFDQKIELPYKYKCWSISETEQLPVDFQFNDNVLPLDIAISIVNDNTFVLGGLYTSFSQRGATGSYIAIINEGSVINKKHTPFDNGTLETLGGKNKVLYSFVTIGIETLNNTYILTTAYRGIMPTPEDTRYYCGNMINIGYSKDSFTKKFEQIIENSFVAKYNYNNNVATIPMNNNLVLIYHQGKHTGGDYKVKVNVIDESGTTISYKEFIMPNDIKHAQVDPADVIQFDSNKILMDATEGSKYYGYGILIIKP